MIIALPLCHQAEDHTGNDAECNRRTVLRHHVRLALLVDQDELVDFARRWRDACRCRIDERNRDLCSG